MIKYRRKLKLNKTSTITIVLIFILIFINIGYCAWTDSQTVIGDIKAKYVENIVFIADADGDYVSKTEDYDLAWGANPAFSFVNSSVTTKNANNIDLYVEYNDAGYLISGRDVILTSNFTNNFDFAITAGTYSESENTINYDYTVSIPETVEPGENATIITTIDIGGNHNIRTGKISYKITYTAGETTKNIIYTINVV